MVYSSILRNKFLIILISLFVISACSTTTETAKVPYAQTDQNEWSPLDTVKSQRFDTGKMWTFEDAPVEYFEETYNFKPDEDWLNDVRMSALKFASWCSASFVSEDGLIMTNHHCVDFVSQRIQQDGEDIKKNGFYAETLADERKVRDVYVDQLVLIEDVTSEMQSALNSGTTSEERVALKDEKAAELEASYSEETGLICRVISLYNGGKYSLYGYKRYSDVRAVFIAESEIGLWGGDPDNFTYPRYNLDCSFLRAYDDDGNPLKTEHYFKWSPNGAKLDEPLFVVGNPGSTERLRTVAQLEFFRDVSYRNQSFIYDGYMDIIHELTTKYPERQAQFASMMMMLANSAKAIGGQLKGLQDDYLIARKKDFEKKFKNSVIADPKLKNKFGHVWQAIEDVNQELRIHTPKRDVYRMSQMASSSYFLMAVAYANILQQLEKPEDEREDAYKSENIQNTLDSIYPDEFDSEFELLKLAMQADYIRLNLGDDNDLVKSLFADNKSKDAAKYLLNNSFFSSKQKFLAAAKRFSKEDPIYNYIDATQKQIPILTQKIEEIGLTEEALNDQLGQALFAVYGTSIPPDATFTLRIGDGVMKGYDYNGTTAPAFTTFYGIYDRYFSHLKKFPWALPEHWTNPPGDLDLETRFNFVSTHDIIGGSSGSPVINKNAEVVGIAFDGNIESLPGDFIYTTKANRMVSVASQGMLEALAEIYSARRLSSELENGKILK